MPEQLFNPVVDLDGDRHQGPRQQNRQRLTHTKNLRPKSEAKMSAKQASEVVRDSELSEAKEGDTFRKGRPSRAKRDGG
jgi:hypothetical protein